MSEKHLDLILEEIGQFGKFQKINFLFVILPLILAATFKFGYVFTAGDLNYRCLIPECESSDSNIFNQEWTKYSIPYKNNKPLKCSRHAYLNNTDLSNYTCSSENFNQSLIVPCTDGYIFDGDEKTIVNEWNITCKENQWRITLVGTMNSVGQFVSLPLAGFLSDKYGRRTVFILGAIVCGIFGLLKSLSFNYPMFVVFEFLGPALGSGFESAAFILSMELVGPQSRALGASLISCAYPVGEVLMGLVSMFLQNWRYLLQIAYIPVFLVISYIWIVPESVRWLLTKGRTDEAVEILKKIAKTNKKRFTVESLQKLYTEEVIIPSIRKDEKYPILKAFKSPALVVRLIKCSFCWLTNTLVYYGLSLNSVSLSGNKFLNFIFVCLIEIPGILFALYLSQKIGRKWSLCGSLLLSGAACFASEFTPKDMPWLTLTLFLIGKLAITTSFCVLYVYTAELFPTNLRHSLLGTCSMFGRIGLIIAPQTPLLATYMSSLPLLMMGSCACISGILVLNFPETLNKKLPDTIEEALAI